MIFISHTYTDKPIVDTIANKIAKVFGTEKVFYDAWSIQPGDGIIDRMSSGISECKFFFFFVSKNSLQSKMVQLEWQNALYKATKNQARFIPIKLDDCIMPSILLQSLYIDIFSQGLEVAVRQMIDVINGISTYRPISQTYRNVQAYAKFHESSLNITIKAETYMEPISKYIFVLDHSESEISWSSTSDNGITQSGFNTGIQWNGKTINALYVDILRATTPSFPFFIEIKNQTGKKVQLKEILRAESTNQYTQIPISVLS